MQDDRVSKGMLTASSMYNHYYGPWNARLHARNYGSIRGGWVAKYRNRNQWIQIDLGVVTRVKRIATQGRYDANQWVKSYTVSYSSDGSRFYPVKHGRRIKVTVSSIYSQILISAGLPSRWSFGLSQNNLGMRHETSKTWKCLRRERLPYTMSRGSFARLLAYTKSFSWLACRVVGRKQTNYATDKPRERFRKH